MRLFLHDEPALLRDLSIITSLHEPICPRGRRRTLVPFCPKTVPNLLFALFLVLFLFSSHGGWSSQSDVSISTENSLSEVSTGTQGTRVSLPQSVQGRNNPEHLSISQVSRTTSMELILTTFLALV